MLTKCRHSRARIDQCENNRLVSMVANEIPTDDRTRGKSEETSEETDSLMIGLEILGLYKAGVAALSTGEIARCIGLPQRRTRQIIETLASCRFLVPLGKADRYRPHGTLRRLNRSFCETPIQDEGRIRAAAASILGELARRTNAIVVLGVRSELWIRPLNCWSPPHSAKPSLPAISLIYESPLGLAWVAAEATERRCELLRQIETQVAHAEMGRIYRTIGDIMDNGFCRAYDDTYGSRLAAPVRAKGAVVASFVCAWPAGETLDFAAMGKKVVEAAGRFAAVL